MGRLFKQIYPPEEERGEMQNSRVIPKTAPSSQPYILLAAIEKMPRMAMVDLR